jgi:hypothetical protein
MPPSPLSASWQPCSYSWSKPVLLTRPGGPGGRVGPARRCNFLSTSCWLRLGLGAGFDGGSSSSDCNKCSRRAGTKAWRWREPVAPCLRSRRWTAGVRRHDPAAPFACSVLPALGLVSAKGEPREAGLALAGLP